MKTTPLRTISSIKARQTNNNLSRGQSRRTDYKKEIQELYLENKRLKRTSVSLAHDLKNHVQSLLLTIESEPQRKQEIVYRRILNQTLAMKETVSLICEYESTYSQHHSTNPIQILFETSMLWEGEVTAGMFCDFDHGTLKIHRGAFRQIMLNLIGNSVKHSVKRPVTVFLTLRKKGSSMELKFRDNGEGIPDHIIEYLETMNPSPNPGSDSGTGLWLIREIIQENEGKLWFEGGAICFTLPATFESIPEI